MYKATQVTVKETTTMLNAFQHMEFEGRVSMDVKVFSSKEEYTKAREKNEWESLSYSAQEEWRQVRANLINSDNPPDYVGDCAFDVWRAYERDLERVPEDCRPKEEEN